MTLYFLPIEPIDKRYTAQWYKWFGEVFRKEGIDYVYVDGKYVCKELGSGVFLDMKETFVWKFYQLGKLFEEKLKDGDIVFVADGEFPGLEAIEYFRKFYNVDVKLVTVWHAGTYDSADLTSINGLGRVGKNVEEAIMDVSDLIFVGTKYHKDIIVKNRIVDGGKIKVTGLPVDVYGIRKRYLVKDKIKRAVFPGRLSWEKGVDIVELVKKLELVDVVMTQRMDLSKSEYYREVAKSSCVFSPARQETFGYGVVEGMSLDCVPVVPDGLSYKEYVPSEYRYKDFLEMLEILRDAVSMCGDESVWECVACYQYEYVIGRMIDEMLKLV